VIEFLNLRRVNAVHEAALRSAVERVIRSGWYILGEETSRFEAEFAAYCGVRHCVGVANGLDALTLILRGLGIGPGDEVIVPAHTFVATWLAVTQVGATPVAAEPLTGTCNLDPDSAEAAITSRTRAILPVHLYGQAADMTRICEIAARHQLLVVEDAAQAHGARHRGRRVGGYGAAAAFSFYPGKNLGACGEAGAVTTNDADLAQKVRMLGDHGQNRKYYHELEGYNGRLDAIQAGILTVKLKHLPEWISGRREAAARYRKLFAEAGVAELAPFEAGWAKPVYHLYVVRVPDREGLMKHLVEAGIGTGIHYPVPLHLQNAYAGLGYRAGDFPVAEKAAAEIVSLPMFPQLTGEQQLRVVADVTGFLSERLVGAHAA
jgi:dTDP-4-amino-4,6-dideoxygalactose transaminase